jgi:GR25 family glycosyltransferase involved in LPS biosynthesis
MIEQHTNGLNNFDIIYFINLEHRTDRLTHITEEFQKTNIDDSKINRINAVYCPDFGGLGCGKSHCIALEQFIESGKDTCIIFEDDFIFTQSQNTINELMNNFFNNVKDFDVLMLSSNTMVEQQCEHHFITKIIDAQTTSGYAVNKKFAPILLNNYRESVQQLERIGHSVYDYCIDIYSKKLQPNSNWYCIYPKIGQQIPGYSDIEKQNVDYRC